MNETIDSNRIGELIKKRRKKKQLTIKDLAGATGLSVGFLSQAERGISVPTLTSLSNIANALGVSLQYFIALPSKSSGVNFIKATEREYYKYENGDEICKVHSDNEHQEINSIIVKTPPHTESEINQHDSDEIIYCIAGNFIYHVDGVDYPMAPGDVIYVPNNTPHKWRNESDEDCIMLWAGGIDILTL